ncbi:hypothetical protein EPN90_01035 [Patescibacteria group bacterium]|nr:MAG: hypothetical protein EPN90_01035 [Patescibacteria group bacterium]
MRCEEELKNLDLPDDPKTAEIFRALTEKQESLNPLKREAIRSLIIDNASKKTSMKSLNPFLWLVPVGALAAFVLFLSAETKTGLLLTTIKPSRQVAVAARLGFGQLPELTATGTAIPQTPKSAAAQKEVSSAVAPAAVGADLAVPTAPLAIGGQTSAGGLTSKPSAAPSAVRCLECDRYLPPRVVYKFTGTMPQIPSEVAVYRLQPRQIPNSVALMILQNIGLTGFTDLTVQNLSFTESGDNPLTWSYDGNSNTLSFWRGSPIVYAEGRADAGATSGMPVPPPPNLQPPTSNLSDEDALKIAAEFLKKRGVDANKFGKPFVQRQNYGWPCKGEVCPLPLLEAPSAKRQALSAESKMHPEIWWNPYLSVVYPALRDGSPVLAWDASPQPGITLGINTQTPAVAKALAGTREPDNGSILLPAEADKSLYPARNNSEILSDALHGGLNPYYGDGGIYPPEQEKKRPVVTITFNEATLAYLERYGDDNMNRYLLPVVGFRGTLKDQYGNISDYGTLVSAVKTGDNAAGNSANSAGQIVPGAAIQPKPLLKQK